MLKKISKAFAPPTAREYAQRKLLEHERELVEARRVQQAAVANVSFHERTIAELRRSLAELPEVA